MDCNDHCARCCIKHTTSVPHPATTPAHPHLIHKYNVSPLKHHVCYCWSDDRSRESVSPNSRGVLVTLALPSGGRRHSEQPKTMYTMIRRREQPQRYICMELTSFHSSLLVGRYARDSAVTCTTECHLTVVPRLHAVSATPVVGH